MILLIFFIIGDSNTLYGMDMTVAVYPSEWDSSFLLPYNGFRTSQGCLDLRYWYQEYQGGFNTHIYKGFHFFYQYERIDDYRVSEERHRFSLRIETSKSYYLNVYVMPGYDKENDEAGIGVGGRFENLWVEFNIGINKFDYNYYLSRVNLETEDPFIRYPVSSGVELLLKGRGYTKLKINRIFAGIREVKNNGVHLGRIMTSSSFAEFRNYFLVNKRLNTDFLFRFREFSSSVDDEGIFLFIPDAPNYTEGSFLSFFYLRINMGEENYFQFGPSYEGHYYISDTLEYRRNNLIFNVFYRKDHGIPYVTWGLQQSIRWASENGVKEKNAETRGVIEIGFDFNERTHFSIIEGLEIDDIFAVKYGLNRLHNHTFVRASYEF